MTMLAASAPSSRIRWCLNPCFEELANRVRSRGLQLPSYSAADGFRKLPAAWLVEHAGFAKGYTKGAAGISCKHARHHQPRRRTAAEIMALKDEIQARVFDEFGITLAPEPVLVSFEVDSM